MKILPIYLHISLILAALPISLQVKSKFKYIQDPNHPEENVPKNQQLHLQSINDKVIKFNKLGSNHDLIVNHIKANQDSQLTMVPSVTNNGENDDDDGHKDRSITNHGSSSYSIEDTEEDTFKSPVSNQYVFKSSRSFINDFLKFKAQQINAQSLLKDSNPQLTTSIKNYDTALNQPDDLKVFTNKVVQEVKEDDDFNDVNFKKYGNASPHRASLPYYRPGIMNGQVPKLNTINFDPKLDIDEFTNYLIKFEGFNLDNLKFLTSHDNGGLDYGLDEIEQELNRIKDQERIDRNIDIEGDQNSCSKTPPNIFFGLIIGVLVYWL